MKLNKNILFTLIYVLLISVLYRILPNRPNGFAPQIAIALFGGMVFTKQKQYSFLLPLVSMFLSDLLYQFLYINNLSSIQGFYDGQFINYILISLTAVFGFGLQNGGVMKSIKGFMIAPTLYFILSNFMVWISMGGYSHPLTLVGLSQTMTDGIPFYLNSVAGTMLFGTTLFRLFEITSTRELNRYEIK